MQDLSAFRKITRREGFVTWPLISFRYFVVHRDEVATEAKPGTIAAASGSLPNRKYAEVSHWPGIVVDGNNTLGTIAIRHFRNKKLLICNGEK